MRTSYFCGPCLVSIYRDMWNRSLCHFVCVSIIVLPFVTYCDVDVVKPLFIDFATVLFTTYHTIWHGNYCT